MLRRSSIADAPSSHSVLDKEAVKSFQRALQLRPSDFETKTLLAEARFNAVANLDQVERDLREVIAAHPDFAFARVVLADLLQLSGQASTGRMGIEARDQRRSELSGCLSGTGRCAYASGSPDKQKEAIKMAEKALELFKKVSEKKVKFSTGLKRLSISHVIFGHANYANNNVMAELITWWQDPHAIRAVQLEKTFRPGEVEATWIQLAWS